MTEAKVTVRMVWEKSTPGTHMFREVDDRGNPIANQRDGKIGTLYVRKSAIGEQKPNEIQVAISIVS